MNLEATLSALITDYENSDWVAVARDAALLVSEIFSMFLSKPPAMQAHARASFAALPKIDETDHLNLLKAKLAAAQAGPNFDWTTLLPILMSILQMFLHKAP